MKKLFLIIVSLCLIASIFSVVKLFTPKVWERNEVKLKSFLIEEKFGGIAFLSNLRMFEWDEMYVFAPNTEYEEIYYTIGYKWGKIKNNNSEDDMQVIFLKNGKVVCYCNGDAISNGYLITANFEGIQENHKVFHYKDYWRFTIFKEEGYVSFQEHYKFTQ